MKKYETVMKMIQIILHTCEAIKYFRKKMFNPKKIAL